MSTINVTNLSGRGGATPNLPDGANITGVATATTFDGNLSGNITGTGLTTGSDGSINVTSIRSVGVSTLGNVVITGTVGGGATVGAYAGVTTFYGDGSALTGVGESIAPWNYNPDVNDTLVTTSTGIGFTFNKKIAAGSGTATLKIVNAGAAGTTIQSWGISSATYNITEFSLGALVSPLVINQTYQLDIPSTFIVDSAGTEYAGTAYTFATQDAVNKLWSIGDNNQGQLGVNNISDSSSPVQIPGTTWVDSSPNTGTGYGWNLHTVMIKTDGTLWSWGGAGNGQLGQNNTTNRSSPTQIGSSTDWNYSSRGYYNSFAKKTDGTLWVWGYNDHGQLGLNNTTQYSSPKQIPGTTWLDVQGGYYNALAIKTDGTLWSWGNGAHGQIGNNTRGTSYSSPIQIPGTNWSTCTAGFYNSYATKTDGTLWSWGYNGNGVLGQNALAKRSSPVQIPGTSWVRAELADSFVFATRTDGTLWGWGQNSVGQLGVNSEVKYSSPVQIPGTTWSQISTGQYMAAAVKTDGTVWAWGNNQYGALGQNDILRRSSPTQIGSESDYTSVATNSHNIYLFQRDTTP